MDATQDILVESSPLPQGPLVPRISGWRPPPATRLMRRTRAGAPTSCELCEVSGELHSQLWHAYGPERNANGALQLARELGLTRIQAKQLKTHFSFHDYHQPAPAGRRTIQQMTELADALSDREQQMLLAVYRQRVLTSAQLSRLFFAPTTSSETSERKSAYRTLSRLRFSHLLFHYRPTRTKRPEVYYFLGRYGEPWVAAHEGRIHGQAYVTDASQISELMLSHDVGAAEVFVAMREQLYPTRGGGPVPMDGSLVAADLPVDCWYGARSLMLGYQGRHGEQLKMVPDGFAALTVPFGAQLTRLPFFIEYDTGYRSEAEVLEQLTAYVQMQQQGVHAQRFPELLPTSPVPVLMVTSTAARAGRLADQLRERLARIGVPRAQLPTFLFTDKRTLQEAPFKPGAWRSVRDAQSDPQAALADHLLAANFQLAELGVLDARLPLKVDLEAGRPAAKGFIPA